MSVSTATDGDGGSNGSSKAAAPDNSRGFVSDIVLNAIEPGVNTSVLIFINVVFALLLFTVVGILLIEFNVLLLTFGLLAAGLMIGVNM